MPNPDACVLLFSGGQDSTTCLYWAKEKFKHVYPIMFQYGQRHAIELKQAEKILKKAALSNFVVEIPLFSTLGGNALTAALEIEHNNQLPNTFVPGRNLLFLNYAAIYATHLGVNQLVGGMCETDYSGYPDCRREFIDSAEQSISLAMGKQFRIHTPLMFLNKAETWLLAEKLGVLSIIVEDSHTCYEGNREQQHAWGYGCGECPACLLRSKGFYEAFPEK